jgi:hypothetical protein
VDPHLRKEPHEREALLASLRLFSNGQRAYGYDADLPDPV